MSFEFEVRPAELKVDIGMPVGSGVLPFYTAVSLIDTVRFCTEQSIRVRMVSPVGSSLVTDARSGVVDAFLKGDATHLFWIDADMFWQPVDFIRLLTFCTQVDVAGATYAMKVEPIRFMMRKLLTSHLSDLGLVETEGLPLGFTCMKRAVVEKVAATKPMIRCNGSPEGFREVFTLGRTPDGDRLGEDMGFFQDIREAGYKVWMDPSINVGHVGLKVYAGDVMESLRTPQSTEEYIPGPQVRRREKK